MTYSALPLIIEHRDERSASKWNGVNVFLQVVRHSGGEVLLPPESAHPP